MSPSDTADSMESLVAVQSSLIDIRKQLLEKLPEDVLDQVPMEAWDRIFGELGSMAAENGESASKKLLRKVEERMESEFGEDIFDDCASVLSDISESYSLCSVPQSEEKKQNRAKLHQFLLKNGDPESPVGKIIKDSRSDSLDSLETEEVSSSSTHLVEAMASSPTVSKKKKGPKKTVSFSQVEMRMYDRTLSDNPSVSAGPALGLDWKFEPLRERISVDEWEDFRQEEPRRTAREMMVPRGERILLLRVYGISHQQIASNTRSIRRDQKRRVLTIQNIKTDDFFDRTTSKIKNIFRRGSKNKNKQKEKKRGSRLFARQ